MRKTLWLFVCVAVFAFVASACGNGDKSSDESSSEKKATSTEKETKTTLDDTNATVVDVTLDDRGAEPTPMSMEVNPASVKTGTIKFVIKNVGTEEHELEVIDADGEELEEVEDISAGTTKDLVMHLDPGTYGFDCVVKISGSSETHHDKGMFYEGFTVTA